MKKNNHLIVGVLRDQLKHDLRKQTKQKILLEMIDLSNK